MPRLNEQTGFIILAVGLAIVVVGLIWLVIRWLPILGSMISRGLRPLLVVLLGGAVAASPILLNKFDPPDDKPIANVTTGERDLTLTGKPGLDYAKELAGSGLTVLNMANPDVTDATLELLRPHTGLKRLDISDSQVTDAGLVVLSDLPALEDLKLTRTKITADGLKALLAKLSTLKAVDVRGVNVPSALLRDWKAADPERKFLK